MHAREVEFWIGASLGDYYKLKVLREANIKRGGTCYKRWMCVRGIGICYKRWMCIRGIGTCYNRQGYIQSGRGKFSSRMANQS